MYEEIKVIGNEVGASNDGLDDNMRHFLKYTLADVHIRKTTVKELLNELTIPDISELVAKIVSFDEAREPVK